MSKNMGLLGRKIGMTQVFTETGERVSVTAVAAGPCVVHEQAHPRAATATRRCSSASTTSRCA